MRATDAAPPIWVRSAVTVEMLELASVTVQARTVVVVLSAGADDGAKVHAETAGATLGALTVSEMDRVPVPPDVSMAVTIRG